MFAITGFAAVFLLFGLSGPAAAIYLAVRLNSRR
jgi:hypothetical protein